MSFLYIIRAASTETPIKIGIANNPSARLRQLQTGHAARLEVVEVFKASNRAEASNWENKAHYLFNDRRALGEWFNVSAKEVVDRRPEWQVEQTRVPKPKIGLSVQVEAHTAFHPAIPEALCGRPLSQMNSVERLEFWACFDLPAPPEGFDDWYIIGTPIGGVLGAVAIEGFVNGEHL